MTKKDDLAPPAAETITPLSVHRKRQRGDAHPRYRQSLAIAFLLCGMVGLAAGGVWLLNYLSQNPPAAYSGAAGPPSGRSAPEEKEPAPPAASLPAVDPAQLALNKVKAEQRLAEFLEIKKVLDRKASSAWGAAAYAEMSELAHQADTHLLHQEYIPAAEKYDRATALAGQLNDRTADALQRLLAEGQGALEEGQGAVAQNKFNVALQIDPANLSARKGLKRAESLAEVVQLIDSGRRHEAAQALAAAQADYRQALRIDPEAEEARQALNRVTAEVNAQQFEALMSAGLTALHKNDYDLANTKLLQARSLKPDSREVADALFQVDQARRLVRIDRLHEQARLADQSEQWQSALEAYLAVLDVDQNLQFAVRGKERALAQIRLAKRLNFFISDPRVLESEQQLENAAALLNEAQAAEPQGPKLAAKIKELESLVAVFRVPVTVIIESDNLTQVAVYKVGKLGRFIHRELKLRPGTYTVLGARNGYKDVRREILVKPGQPSMRVTVKCRIKI